MAEGTRSYKDLDVWRLAMDLAEASYRRTAKFPTEERFGLTSQSRRAAASIPANIAEGYGRETTVLYIQFLRIAQGSQKELETHLLLAQRIEMLGAEAAAVLLGLTERISMLLCNQIRALQTKKSGTSPNRTSRIPEFPTSRSST